MFYVLVDILLIFICYLCSLLFKKNVGEKHVKTLKMWQE